MSEMEPTELINIIVQIMIKLYIIINASKLGWSVEIYDDKLILAKKSSLLTRLDEDTPKLMSFLMSAQ
jgi:hypothetical protein